MKCRSVLSCPFLNTALWGWGVMLLLMVAQPAVVSAAGSGTPVRTKAEVEALIAQAGSTAPDWWNTVTVKYPPTLDLTWAPPANKQWNPQKNLGQYVWDIINPNPGKWREGVRLMHHVLTMNKDNKAKLGITAGSLAHMYQNLLQDWARAVFWRRKALQLGHGDEDDAAIDMAECYLRLGSREMCVEAISQLAFDDTRNGSLIKLWSELGELDKALKLAEEKAENDPDAGYLAAGDACRSAGKYAQAIAYYQKVVAIPLPPKPQGDLKRNRERAAASMEAVKLFDALDVKRVPDGRYRGQSPAYAGPLHVEVQVSGGRIGAVKVVQHQEKQFYSAITDTTKRIVEKQSVKGIDGTSGATITSEAIVNATAKALAGKGR